MPAYYESDLLIADEGKEMDISIGLNSFEAWMKKDFMGEEPLKDPEVYAKILGTKEYLSRLSTTQLKSRGITYSQYLDLDSAAMLDQMVSNFRYRHYIRYNTIGIRFSDRDAHVAAEMADSCVTMLRTMLREQYVRMADIKLANVKKTLKYAKAEYKKAQRRYDRFADTHADIASDGDRQTLEALDREKDEALQYYNDQTEQYVRAMAQTERRIPVFSYVKRPVVAVKPYKPSYLEYSLTFCVIAIILNYWRVLYKRTR